MLLSHRSTSRSSAGTNEQPSIQRSRLVSEAFRLTWHQQKNHLFTSWVHVPIGVMSLLVVTWGLRLAIAQAPFRFPTPVIAMLLFFVALLALDGLSSRFPGHKSKDAEKADAGLSAEFVTERKRFVDPFMALLAPPCEFLLRNMSVMFTPSFVLIPARELIPGKEIGLLTAWFLITQVLAFVFPVLLLWGINWVVRNARIIPGSSSKHTSPPAASSLAATLPVLAAKSVLSASHQPRDIDMDLWRHLESTALEQARQQGDPAVISSFYSTFGIRSPRSDVSTFAHHRHHGPGRIGRSKTSPDGTTLRSAARLKTIVGESSTLVKDDSGMHEMDSDMETRVNSRNASLPDLSRSRSMDLSDEPIKGSKPLGGEEDRNETPHTAKDEEVPASDDDSHTVEGLASWFGDLITPTIYLLLTIIGIPLYFVADIALPLFLGINILTFIAAITLVPPKIRRVLHPILSCSITTVLIIWAFGAMRGLSLKDNLNRFYSVDARYSDLWSPSGYRGPVPGAGDVLFSTLDAGIVALAVPMYRYRSELKANFVQMIIVLSFCATLSLFLWNSIAALMGMDETRSLAFTARFMSTPLAIELAGNIGADESITVILVVLTGIIAAILKDLFFRLMRVDREDHLIVGITMGSTAGAIGASSLISTPKVMAVASLSFVIFGTILLVATAIPPIVDIVRMLA